MLMVFHGLNGRATHWVKFLNDAFPPIWVPCKQKNRTFIIYFSSIMTSGQFFIRVFTSKYTKVYGWQSLDHFPPKKYSMLAYRSRIWKRKKKRSKPSFVKRMTPLSKSDSLFLIAKTRLRGYWVQHSIARGSLRITRLNIPKFQSNRRFWSAWNSITRVFWGFKIVKCLVGFKFLVQVLRVFPHFSFEPGYAYHYTKVVYTTTMYSFLYVDLWSI